MASTPGLAKLQHYHPHIQAPLIVGAPVRPYALHRLATAVTRAGGLGFISATPSDIEEFTAAAKALTDQPLAGQEGHEPGEAPILPIGIGYLCWMVELETAVQNVTTHRVGSVWLYAWNDLEHLRSWVSMFRTRCPWVVIYIQVLNVAEALAVLETGCNNDTERLVLIAQGSDAGGHGAAQGNASLMTLLPELRLTLATHGFRDIPLLAAGGIVDGVGAAAALMLGASGIVLGTRLLATAESAAPPGFKRHLVRATDGGTSTVRTRLFDDLRGTSAFPPAYDGRALRNRSTDQQAQGVSMDALKERYATALDKWNERAQDATGEAEHAEEEQDRADETWGESGRLTTYAGTCVGLIADIQKAEDVVTAVREGIVARVDQLARELKG